MRSCYRRRNLLLLIISFNLFSSYLIPSFLIAQSLEELEKQRIELNKKHDKMYLREKNDFVTNSSMDFLIEPPGKLLGKYIVAKIPPTVKMRILPDLVPEYYNGEQGDNKVYLLGWANWGRVTRSEDNRFYFAASDHRGFGCHINIYEYSPSRNILHKVVDVGQVLGWTDKSYTDGKIHGHMGIMPDGTLWCATHYGVLPDSIWYANGYRGSWLFCYNIFTHEAINWGIPLVGNSLSAFHVDTKHGKLVATGENFTVLCWDCINKKVTYAGYPPNGWIWWRRGMFCDAETGKFWTTDDSDEKHRFMSFEPGLNKFVRYNISPPPNPYTHYINVLRGYTDKPAKDGWYYCCSKSESGPSGLAFFRFKPEGTNGPVVESLGVTWDKGMDTIQMVVSSKGRYVYYLPLSNSAPLIQYDVENGTKKALCWLGNYYFEKYGYYINTCYGMEISKDGSFIVACLNGEFQERGGGGYGHPSLFVITIPEEERKE